MQIPSWHDWTKSLTARSARSGVEAARRKFTPEFINRLDKIVTFQPLGSDQLRKILDIELTQFSSASSTRSPDRSFVFTDQEKAKDFLLDEGTDLKYGARHLKRAIERLLVQPMSNLIATDQVRRGDHICVDLDPSHSFLMFVKEAETLPMREMEEWRIYRGVSRTRPGQRRYSGDC